MSTRHDKTTAATNKSAYEIGAPGWEYRSLGTTSELPSTPVRQSEIFEASRESPSSKPIIKMYGVTLAR